jgi:Rrf2 family transcriptional regulator, cysteine metabolism repressor
MTLLNRKVDYALLVLSYLHHHPEGGCARAVADRFQLSRGFTANILKRLCREGFVESHRGIKGGYFLRPAVLRESLAGLMDAFDDSFRLAECNAEEPSACCQHYDGCPVKGPIAEVDRRIRKVLGDVTLAELFGSPSAACQSLPVVSG